MPLREIGDKFTKSELVLVAWRSQEQHYHFKKKMNDIDEERGEAPARSGKKGSKRKRYDGIGPERMPDRFYAQEALYDARGKLIADAGDFNLAQVPGEDARRYFEQVLKIPMPPNQVSKIRYSDEATEQIRQAYNIRS